jgi:transposase
LIYDDLPDSLTLKVQGRHSMSAGFWLSDRAWAAIEPLLPTNQPGARRVDDRRVISGIIHVLRVGCRWEDCPADYGPSTTIYNRFNRWSHRGLWGRIFATLAAQAELPGDLSIDSTAVRAHRSAHGGKGGRKFRPSGARVAVQPPRSML